MIKKAAIKTLSLLKTLLIIIFSYLPFFVLFSCEWALNYYSNITTEEILFHITSNLSGTSSEIIKDFIIHTIPPTMVIGTIVLLVFISLYRILKEEKIYAIVSIINKEIKIRIPKTLVVMVNIVLLIGCFYYSLTKIGITEFVKYQFSSSEYIEKNYVDPKKTTIEFPKTKRNLIFIVVESLESSFFSSRDGGATNTDYLKSLLPLTKHNVNFSNTEKIGGSVVLTSTGWTSSALVAMTSGMPLKMSADLSMHTQLRDLLPGAYTIGDLLKDNGYNQEFILGSDADFGNRRSYFVNHGNYDIVDYLALKERKLISDDYYVFWGVEDSLLYSFAQKDLTKLAKEDKPFNLTLLTVNTHAEGGYLEKSCSTKYDKQIYNVFSCTGDQLMQFINWIQKQSFYKDTTIVITGDHTSMEPTDLNVFYENGYRRTVYNLFINSSVKPVNEKNRMITMMDMYPTTLAAMGVKIEGDRLALGTNLFSEKRTLMEEYGDIDAFNEEINKKSTFYNNYFFKSQ